MHPAPSLLEAPPQTTPPQADPPPPAPPPQPDAPTLPEPRPDLLHAEARRSSRKRRAQSPELAVPDRLTPLRSLSPPGRKDTMSSTSTVASAETVATSYGTDHLSAGSSYSADHPTRSGAQLPSQAVFSVKDLQDPDGNRRPSRRRTGPLTPQQREKAALIRKLGACPDCRRRRVAVSHHCPWLAVWPSPTRERPLTHGRASSATSTTTASASRTPCASSSRLLTARWAASIPP